MRLARRRTTTARAVPALAACALVLTACSSAGAGRGVSFVSGDGTVTVLSPSQRNAPVTLSGRTLSGAPLDVASMRGRPVVVNVWGSWCGPCRKEAPALEAAYQRLRGLQVGFVGLDTRDDVAQARAYERAYHLTYPSLADDDGKSLLALHGVVSAPPTTLVLDRQGRVAARVTGGLTTTTLVDLVTTVLDEKAG